MNKILFSIFAFLFIFTGNVKSQMATSNTAPYNSATNLVNNVLLGQGVSASNITFTGNPAQIGFFSAGLNGTPNLGLDSGIVMSTGDINDIPPGGNQPNIGQYAGPGDLDLLSVAQSVTSNPQAVNITQTQDAAFLEFDFTPTGDSVRFNFVFASEEYPDGGIGGFVNSQFNDVFAFFVSGPGITGPFASPAGFPNGAVNIAVIPGTTTPITISTIYVDPNQIFPLPTSLNAALYVDNTTEQNNDFNGFTIPISIVFPVTCNATYHFKIAIADAQDDFLDTGVFLEGASFSSEAVQVNVVAATGDSTVIEGCADADIVFTRPDTVGTLTVHFAIGGTAINGTDYNLIADSIVFLPGIATAILNITPIADGLVEGPETITITVTTIDPCGNTIISTGIIYILDVPNMFTVAPDSTLLCPLPTLPIYVQATNALAPYTYVWTDSGGSPIGTNNDTIIVPGLVTDTFYVSITDSCNLVTINDTVIITVNAPIPTIQTTNDTILSCPNYTINIGAIPADGVTVYTYDWGPNGAGANVTVSPTQTTTYIVSATDACGVTTTDSVVATVNYSPLTINLSDDIILDCPNLTYSVQIIGTPIDGTAPYTYNWGASSIDTDNTIDISVNTPQIISTTVTDFCNLTANSDMNITFAPYTPLSLSTILVDSTCANETVSLTATATDGVAPYSYLWSNGGTGSPTTFTSSTIGENVVTVTVTDECTLQQTTDMIVDIINCKVDIITVITPNGDQMNDFLTFKGIENFPNNHLTVLSRWGKTLLETDNYKNDWDGNNANEGTYFYVLELNNSAGTIHKGTFTLLK